MATFYTVMCFACARRELAEDLVQDTLLAAIEAQHRFAAGSSERTWLISILRRSRSLTISDACSVLD